MKSLRLRAAGAGRAFGKMANLFERRPHLCNGVAGFAVYAGGEAVAQKYLSGHVDSKRCLQTGTLGIVENGILMVGWFQLLDRVVGRGAGALTVMAKCACDQAFFAPQADSAFLAFSAYLETESPAESFQRVREKLLTTWATDTMVWPSLNFIGFSAVPSHIMPTYTACLLFFWQIFMSVNSAGGPETSGAPKPVPTRTSSAVFRALDKDGNGYIDRTELSNAMLSITGKRLTRKELNAMLAEADMYGDGGQRPDGKVSASEFRALVNAASPVSEQWQALLAHPVYAGLMARRPAPAGQKQMPVSQEDMQEAAKRVGTGAAALTTLAIAKTVLRR